MDKFDYADEKGQEKVIEQLNKIFSNCTVEYEQHFDDKNGIDIYFTVTTPKGKEYKYAAECKDRVYEHTFTDKWILEKKKYEDLIEASEQGYKPLYINTYTDDWMNVWDVSKCTVSTTNDWILPSTTVINKGYKTKKTLLLDEKEAVFSKPFV